MSAPPLLDFQHVTVHRGARSVLHDLSLRISQGEHVALIGPNGCGKSTLIQTINRDLYPQPRRETVCRLFGEETWDVFELRTRLGIVSNDLHEAYRREVTGFEIVLSGFFSSIGLWPAYEITSAMESQTREVIDFLGVQHLADRPATEMSSGEGRRLLIGRALVHDPAALLLDEPTNSLDFRAAHEFRETVSRLAQAGRTILMVTHTIADVIPEIERVVLLKDGDVFRDGAKDAVLTAPSLSALFGVPIQVEQSEGRYRVW